MSDVMGQSMRIREKHILDAMDHRNRVRRLEWLLAGPMPDHDTRNYFRQLLAEEMRETENEKPEGH